MNCCKDSNESKKRNPNLTLTDDNVRILKVRIADGGGRVIKSCRVLLRRLRPLEEINGTAAARGAPRHDQRILSGVYGAYVLERCSSESEDTTIDILERCISQSEISMWRCVKSSRESGDDESELGCGIYGPK